ncbi:MAG: zinc ribbon domain-containing protein [Candidatus Nitrosoabyssus spongiisocia]|nr:MAG: zinc ribbon domain-containing protein [Nitrosopumilaceae archaeon AB1(1)]
MSLGDIDTLNLLSDKLDALFNDSQGYYESFLDANNLFKSGKITNEEFFKKLGDYVVAYSALEFLAIKVLQELKKTVNKISGNPNASTGVGTNMAPGMMSPGMNPSVDPRMGTVDNPVGRPPGIVSTDEFSSPGTLPTPDPSLVSQSTAQCSNCGNPLRAGSKFCTSCGTRL